VENQQSPSRLRSALVAIGVTGGVFILILPLLSYAGTHKRDQLCRSNLHKLGAALWIYQEQYGKSPYGVGSNTLIRLYKTGIVVDPKIYLCPATGDTNDGGKALRWGQGRMPRNAVSYASPRKGSALALRGAAGAAQTAVASDDQEGLGGHFNHGDHLHVLFLDGHVERIEFSVELPPQLGRDTPLQALAN